VLSLGEHRATWCTSMFNPILVSVLGLLVQTPVKAPEGPVSKLYTLDSFQVVERGDVSSLDCKCGRHETIHVATSDLERSHPVLGVYACPICLEELRAARSPSDKVAVWFKQNRLALTPDQHIFLPCTFARLVDSTDKTIMRPRRFVYAKFHGVALSDADKILTTCGEAECVNPYHMMLAASPATKVTPEMREDVRTWVARKIRNKTIQELLKSKYNRDLSLRTITNIKKSVLA
jgi:hypothetical protein